MLAVCFIICVKILHAQGSEKKIELIKFESTEHDYGDIEEVKTAKAEHTFKFKNISGGPVKVVEAKPSCGCTTPSWSQDPISRAREGFVMASYDPKNRPGKFEKTITVRVAKYNLAKKETDTVEVQTILLRIKGNVIPKPKSPLDVYKFEEGNLRFTSNNFGFGTIAKKGTKSKNITFYNAGKKKITITNVESKPYIQLSFVENKKEIKSKDSLHATITYNLDAAPDYDWQNERVYLITDDDTIPKKTLYVNATLLPDFSGMTKEDSLNAPKISFDAYSINLGKMEKGTSKPAEFKLKNVGKRKLDILKLKTSCTCISITGDIKSIPPGETAVIKATFRAETKGELNKTIRVLSNDYKSSMLTLSIRADIYEPEKPKESNEKK